MPFSFISCWCVSVCVYELWNKPEKDDIVHLHYHLGHTKNITSGEPSKIKHLVHSTNCQKQLCNLRRGIQHLLSLHAFVIINIEIFILQTLQHDTFPPFKVKMQCMKFIDTKFSKPVKKKFKRYLVYRIALKLSSIYLIQYFLTTSLRDKAIGVWIQRCSFTKQMNPRILMNDMGKL